jgi:PmbA protein
MLSQTQAASLAADLVAAAMKAGASSADAMIGVSRSSSISVRLGELEDVDRSESFEVGLRLFDGQRSATVSSASLDPADFPELAQRAFAMARQAPEDPYAGLADPALLGDGIGPDLDLFDPTEPDLAALRARAKVAEEAARAVSGVTNSNGGSAGTGQSLVALATSTGFARASQSSHHSVSASVVAGEAGALQRDYAYHGVRHLTDLESAEVVGTRAGTRAVARLNPVRPPSGPCPIFFDPRVSASLLGHFVASITGSAIARKTSFSSMPSAPKSSHRASSSATIPSAVAVPAAEPSTAKACPAARSISSPMVSSPAGSPTQPPPANSASHRPAMPVARSAEALAPVRPTSCSCPAPEAARSSSAPFLAPSSSPN